MFVGFLCFADNEVPAEVGTAQPVISEKPDTKAAVSDALPDSEIEAEAVQPESADVEAAPPAETGAVSAVPAKDTTAADNRLAAADAEEGSRVIVSGTPEDGENFSGKTVISGEKSRKKKKKVRAFSLHSGLSLSGLAANNLFSLTDFFQDTLVIDLNNMSDKMIRSGMHISMLVDFEHYFQFTIKEAHTVKFSSTVSGNAWGNLSKDFIDFLAEGNGSGDVEGKGHAVLEVFADMGCGYHLKKKNYGVSARLAYFIPVVYLTDPTFKTQLSASGGSIDMAADLYVHPAFMSNGSIDFAKLLSNGGVDLSLNGNYAPTSWVDVLFGISYLPLFPARMDKGSTVHKTMSNNLNIFDQGSGVSSGNSSVGSLPEKKVLRPAKIRIGADFRPFSNNYLIVTPFIAAPIVRVKPFYMDGGAKIESRFAKDILGVSYALNYIERVVRHDLDFFVDSRWFTFNIGVSVASQSFTRTFYTLSGAAVRLGFGAGF